MNIITVWVGRLVGHLWSGLGPRLHLSASFYSPTLNKVIKMVLWFLWYQCQLKPWIQEPLKYVGTSLSAVHSAVFTVWVFPISAVQIPLEKDWGNQYYIYFLSLCRIFCKRIQYLSQLQDSGSENWLRSGNWMRDYYISLGSQLRPLIICPWSSLGL